MARPPSACSRLRRCTLFFLEAVAGRDRARRRRGHERPRFATSSRGALHGAARHRRRHGLGARPPRDRPLARTRRSSAGCTRSGSRSTRGRRRGRATTSTGSCSPPAASTTRRGALDRLGELVPGTARSRSSPTRRDGDPRRRAPSRRSAPGSPTSTRCPPARRRRRLASSSGSGASCASTAAGRSSRSAAAARPISPASPRRPISAASPGCPCRRRSSARSTRRSAARRRSTFPRARTSSAPSTGRRATVIDPALLETLPSVSGGTGMAEVVKTGLLAASRLDARRARPPLRRLQGRRSACRDPHDRGPRALLNLGHTFAHALEAAAGLRPPARRGGRARAARRARGSPAADTAAVERGARPAARSRVDPERAWQALLRDKKRDGTRSTSSCSATTAPYVEARPADEVRRALERLIAIDARPCRSLVLNGVNLDMLGAPRPGALRRAVARASSRRRSTSGRTSST